MDEIANRNYGLARRLGSLSGRSKVESRGVRSHKIFYDGTEGLPNRVNGAIENHDAIYRQQLCGDGFLVVAGDALLERDGDVAPDLDG